MEHFNKLTPAEAERLALVAEECAEVIQVIGKILRHGFESYHPDGGETNRGLLMQELGDLDHAIMRMMDAKDIDLPTIEVASHRKAERVGRYLHHQA